MTVKQPMSATKKRDLIAETAQRLKDVLEVVPFVEVVQIEQQIPSAPGRVPDLVAEIQMPGGKRRLVVEVKTEGLPRTLRNVAQTLRARLADLPNTYGVVAAPYISDRSRDLCRQVGVGCLDLAGNVSLAFEQVFIERSGNPNPLPVRQLQRSLFAPRSTRVLRILLADPKRQWYVRDLAAEAGISRAQTSKVKRLLCDQDLLAEERRAFWLEKPEELLRDWTQVYTYEANDVGYFYSMLRTPEAEERLAAECECRGIRYGLALFSGANRVAPFTRYNRAFAFVEEKVEEIVESLRLKPVPSGANVALLRPYDEGVFDGLQEVEGAKVVSDVQLYLDLKSYKGRGEEAADFLYERRIKPRWNLRQDQTTQPKQ